MPKTRLPQVAVLLSATTLFAMNHKDQRPGPATLAPLTSAALKALFAGPPDKDSSAMTGTLLTYECEYVNATGEALTFILTDCPENGAGSVVASLDGDPEAQLVLSPRDQNSFRLAAGGRVSLAIAAPRDGKFTNKFFVLFAGSRHLGNLAIKVLEGDRIGLTLVPPPGPAKAYR